MKATEILRSEHRVIEGVFDSLDRIVDESRARDRLCAGDVRDILDFLRHFVRGYHQGKEENGLFPAMVAQGYPRDTGPIAVALREHEESHRHLLTMEQALGSAAAGDSDQLRSFLNHAQTLAQLLRQHFHKEDNILFVLANHVLASDQKQELLECFARIEAEQGGVAAQEKYLAFADWLAAQRGLPPKKSPP
jgi:hemerythrin-like domain-containing protein